MDTTVKWPLGLERSLLADACREHFWPFLCYAFGVKKNPKGTWLDEEIHKPLCDWLEKVAREWLAMRASGNQERFYILIDAARDSGKTVIVTKAFTAWLHLQEPDMASVIDSLTMERSMEFAEIAKRLWEGKDPCAYFTWLYGKWEGPDIWTKKRLVHRARKLSLSEASLECISVDTGATGDHPDHITIDDPVSRDKLRESGNYIQVANTHFGALFPVLKNDSLLILCATPYVDGDVVTNAIVVDGIKELIGQQLPMEYRKHLRKDGKWRMYYMPAAGEDGKTLMPKSWPQHELDNYRKKYPAEYAAQCLLRPGAGDQVPLTWDQIQECEVERKDVPKNLTYTIHCDTAFKHPDRMGQGDESVIEVWGHAQNGAVYFIEGYGSNRWLSEDFTDKLVMIVQRYKKSGRTIRWMTDDKTLGGKEGVWRDHLQSCFSNAQMWMPPFLELNRRAGPNKTARIAETAGYWVDGHVFLVKDAPGLDQLKWQMARIGVSEHDDWAECAADVFHPEVYCPMLPPGADAAPPPPSRPWDRELQTGRISNSDAQDIYDTYFQDEEPTRWMRDPIR